jgi:hypothetical protein
MFVAGARRRVKMSETLQEQKLEEPTSDALDLEGKTAESWHCVDCGVNRAPGIPGRADMERAFAEQAAAGVKDEEQGVKVSCDSHSEVYTVRAAVWKETGLGPMDGCLCIGCLEKRIGRRLRPKDFQRDHPFNNFPGTPRLLQRRGRPRGYG